MGTVAGRSLMKLYTEVFRFPLLTFKLDLGTVVGSILFSFGSAVVGALAAVRQVARLPPAEAMRPLAPPTYRPTLLERSGFHRLFSQSGRMVLRDLERRPWRLLLSSLGIGLAVAILIVGTFSIDAVRYLIGVQYGQIQREALSVSFTQSVPDGARRELEQLPGVLHTEPLRMVPVRLVAGPRSYETAIQGGPAGGEHRRVLDSKLRPVPLEGEGLMLGRELARRLGVGLGDPVRMEVLDGDRPVREARVVLLVNDLIGLSAYMELEALDRMLGDGYRVEARITLWDEAEVVQVPESALFRQREGWAVFLADAGRVRLRPVKLGQRNGLRAQVLEGLAPGDKVIVHPGDNVRDGVSYTERPPLLGFMDSMVASRGGVGAIRRARLSAARFTDDSGTPSGRQRTSP